MDDIPFINNTLEIFTINGDIADIIWVIGIYWIWILVILLINWWKHMWIITVIAGVEESFS